MKFRKCPRCEARAYEDLRTYAVCHDCQFNTVEGYYWQREPEIPKYSVSPKVVSKFDSDNAVRAVAQSVSAKAFTKTDCAIIRNALLVLSELQRNIMILRFWKNMDSKEISLELHTDPKLIEKELLAGFEQLKKIALANPAFSRNLKETKPKLPTISPILKRAA